MFSLSKFTPGMFEIRAIITTCHSLEYLFTVVHETTLEYQGPRQDIEICKHVPMKSRFNGPFGPYLLDNGLAIPMNTDTIQTNLILKRMT